jgi:hypothetical protein
MIIRSIIVTPCHFGSQRDYLPFWQALVLDSTVWHRLANHTYDARVIVAPLPGAAGYLARPIALAASRFSLVKDHSLLLHHTMDQPMSIGKIIGYALI